MLPDPSEAPRLGSVNLPCCMPAVGDEEEGDERGFSFMVYK